MEIKAYTTNNKVKPANSIFEPPAYRIYLRKASEFWTSSGKASDAPAF